MVTHCAQLLDLHTVGPALACEIGQDALPHIPGLLHHFGAPAAALIHDGRGGGVGPLDQSCALGFGTSDPLLSGAARRLQHLHRLVAESLGHPGLQIVGRGRLELHQALGQLGHLGVEPAYLRGGLLQAAPHPLGLVAAAHNGEIDLLD